MQVRNGLSIHNQDLTSQPVSFLTNCLNGKTNFLNGDNFKCAKLRQYKEHLCVLHPDSLVDSVLSHLLPSSCLPLLIQTLSLAPILSLSLSQWVFFLNPLRVSHLLQSFTPAYFAMYLLRIEIFYITQYTQPYQYTYTLVQYFYTIYGNESCHY